MSRIGKKPIQIPSGVTVTLKDDAVTVSGPKGTLSRSVPKEITVTVEGDIVTVDPKSDDKKGRSLHGLMRTLINNMVTGVNEGFKKGLEIVGVGFRSEVDGNVLRLHVGYSNPVEYAIVDGISIDVERQLNITVSGIDKELVGKVAAEIRAVRKPEPYKGKGIRYAGEQIRRKVGKSAGA